MDRVLDIPATLLIDAIAMLDSLPDYIRAMLAAGLLVLFLRFFERRISSSEIQFGQSFRKTALVSLILIPLLVWQFPSSRMVVFVEELPRGNEPGSWLWWTVLGIWLAGAVLSLLQLCRRYQHNARDTRTLPELDDPKLKSRLAHWQRRLGLTGTLTLTRFPGDRPRQLRSRGQLGFPAAAIHWPGSAQDILIIHSLGHLKAHHGRWHSISQIVSCLYWPCTWLQTLHRNLLNDFQRVTDELAESCFQDHLGYQRALKQLTQRLQPTASSSTVNAATARNVSFQRLRQYLSSLQFLRVPEPEPAWNLENLVQEREAAPALQWTDPYDRVVLCIGQAVFLAFLLTGVTLREQPPELDYEYAFPFELLWKESFHRNQELLDRIK